MTHEQASKLNKAENLLYTQVYKMVEAVCKEIANDGDSEDNADEVEELKVLANLLLEASTQIQFCREEFTNN